MEKNKQIPFEDARVYVRECGFEACAPCHCFGPAVRDYFLLHIVSKGKGVFQNDWGQFEITKGHGFMIFPNEVTVYTADRLEPWEYHWVGFSGAKATALADIFGVTQRSPVVALGKYADKAALIIDEIYSDSAALDLSDLAATGGLYRLAALAGQCMAPPDGAETATESKRYYQKAYWHMEANFQRDLHITDVARFVGLSRSQLFRVFIANGGISPQRALCMLRLTQAETLLKETELPLKAVALSAGFSSAARMGEVFRQEKGMTPTEFRLGGKRAQ